MAAYGNTSAHNKAIEIVTAGLSSGAIKLTGPHSGGGKFNEENIAGDAAYVNGLINAIAQNLTKVSD